MTVFSSNRCDNAVFINVDSVTVIDRDITRCYQLNIFDGYIYDRIQNSINDDYCENIVLAEDAISYNTTLANNGGITRYYQIDRSADVLYSITTLKLTPNTEALIKDIIGGNVNNSIEGITRHYQIALIIWQ